jgi:hypothetical protein
MFLLLPRSFSFSPGLFYEKSRVSLKTEVFRGSQHLKTVISARKNESKLLDV